ncbi:MAG: RNA-binding S4 domain-containing protein [Trueperaceae bacterium]
MTDEGDVPTLPLAAALKLAGHVGTGGQAKQLIQAGEVRVNGEVETRRKRRLRAGDEIEVAGASFVLDLDAPDPDEADPPDADADPPDA